MFYPLRMTRGGDGLQYYSISPHPSASLPPSPQEKALSKASLKQEGEKYLLFTKTKIDYRLHFLFAKDDTQEAFSCGEGEPLAVDEEIQNNSARHRPHVSS